MVGLTNPINGVSSKTVEFINIFAKYKLECLLLDDDVKKIQHNKE